MDKIRIRLGYVTNSSSTNHIIMWKGAKEDLRNLLELHSNIFPLSYEYGLETLEVEEIIEAICSLQDKIQPIENFIEICQDNLEYYEALKRDQTEILSEEKYGGWLENAIARYREDIENYHKDIEKAQFQNWYIEVSFGDNHGDFCGGALGNIMDYGGQHIEVNEPIFKYSTKNQH